MCGRGIRCGDGEESPVPPKSKSNMPSSSGSSSSIVRLKPSAAGELPSSSSSESSSSIDKSDRDEGKSPLSERRDEGVKRGDEAASAWMLMPRSREPRRPDAGGETAAGLWVLKNKCQFPETTSL